MPKNPPNLLDYIDQIAQAIPDNVCMQVKKKDDFHYIRYGELMGCVGRFAKRIQDKQILPGSHIAIISEAIPEAVNSLLAVFSMRCTAVLLDPSLPNHTITELIHASQSILVLVSDEKLGKISEEIKKSIPVLLIEHELDDCPGATKQLHTQDINKKLDTALILFTSGTSGINCGVLISHEAILYQVKVISETVGSSPRDVVLHMLPFNHIAPVMSIFCSLFTGSAIHFIPKMDKKLLLEQLPLVKPTIFPTVPRVLELLVNSLDKKINELPRWKIKLIDLLANINLYSRRFFRINLGPIFFKKVYQFFGGRLRVFFSGSAPLSIYTHKRFDQFGIPIFYSYGLTETTSAVTLTRLDDYKYGSVGKPLKGMQVKISHPNEKGEGEIVISSPCLMLGYLNDEEATKKALKNNWLYTGDLGYLDQDGYLYITGRLKEIIVTEGGKKALPVYIETQYGDIEGVKEYVVFGVPAGEKSHDVIYAAIVIDPGYGIDTDKAKNALKGSFNERSQQLPAHLRIQKFFFTEEIPRTSTLKPKRVQLRNEVLASFQKPEKKGQVSIQVSERVLTPLDDLKQLIRKSVFSIIAHGESMTDLSDTQSFYELGMDSIALTELYQQLQGSLSGKTILPPSIINDYPSVEGLAYVIMELMKRKEETSQILPPFHKMQTGPINPVSLQQQYWLERQAKTDLRTGYISLCFSLTGELNFGRFKQALLKIAQHQQILRTTFIIGENAFQQQINEQINFTIEHADLSGATSEEEAIKNYIDQVLARKCDYVAGPLGGCHLLRLPNKRSAILLAFHHLIFDGISTWIMLNQLNYYYDHGVDVEENINEILPVQYADFALWQRQAYQGEILKYYERYWVSRLVESKPFTFPYEHESNTYQGEVLHHHIPLSTKKQIKKFIEKNHGTEFCLYYLAFLLTVAKVSNAYDITLSVPQSGRFDSKLNNLIGFIASTCLSRFKWSKDASNLQVYQDLHKHLQDLREFYIPIQLVKLFAKSSPINTGYHVIFSYMKPNIQVGSLFGHQLDKIYQTSQPFYHDIVWYLLDYADQVSISCTYNQTRYRRNQILEYLNLYLATLSQIIEGSQKR